MRLRSWLLLWIAIAGGASVTLALASPDPSQLTWVDGLEDQVGAVHANFHLSSQAMIQQSLHARGNLWFPSSQNMEF